MTQKPQAIQEEEFPDVPAVQAYKTIDDDADQAQADRIQRNYAEDAHYKINPILQAGLHGDADQSDIEAQRFDLFNLPVQRDADAPSPKPGGSSAPTPRPRIVESLWLLRLQRR